ncbi:GNAT family N-acetyltransferase [Bacillus tianshenii]|nr:GNAT family N-acetyltransferase [Bacillus tianshenii]
MVSIVQIKSDKDFSEWERTIEKWIIKQKSIIPQISPVWFKVFQSFKHFNCNLLIAHEKGKIKNFFFFVKYNGIYGSVIHCNPFIVYGGFPVVDFLVWRKLIDKLFQIAINEDCITVTLCTPPFQEVNLEMYKEVFKPDYCYSNFYQYSLLNDHPVKKLRAKRRAAFKNEIRRGNLSGITISIENSMDKWNEWYKIYFERYKEVGANPYPKELFLKIYEELVSQDKAKLFCGYNKGEMIGGTLILLGNKIADYFASAYTGGNLNVFSNTVVLDSIFNWLIQNKYELYNWESSPEKSGVYNYKARWGAKEGKHIYMTKVIGDASNILSKDVNKVKKEYKGIYILPYNLWGE